MSHDPSHPDPEPAAGKPTTPRANLPTGSAPVDDAGTQALSEALRSSFHIVRFLMLGLVVVFVASGVFTVQPNEMAVLLRFGKPVGLGPDQLLPPGLHWKLPAPVDEVVRIKVGETHTLVSTAGWYFVTPEEEVSGQRPQENPFLRPGVDGYTLAGDGNIIHARATLSYRINDPLGYAFNFAHTTNLLQDVVDNALAYASARFTADDALYRNKLGFQELVLKRVNETVDRLKLGITVDPREIRTSPPLYVEGAFNDVVKAQQTGDQRIREAESYARGSTNKAVGEASAIVRDGLTLSNALLATIQADATNFLGLRPSYERNPRLFEQRFQAETLQRVLTGAQFKAFLPRRADGKPREVRLQFNKEIPVPVKTGATPAK
jgi:modulator of FtsH protease HflK